jgi:hypothetical protein
MKNPMTSDQSAGQGLLTFSNEDSFGADGRAGAGGGRAGHVAGRAAAGLGRQFLDVA